MIFLCVWFCSLILGYFSSKLSQIQVCFVMLNLMNGNINWCHNGTNLTDLNTWYLCSLQAVFFSLCISQNVYSGFLIYILEYACAPIFFFWLNFCSLFSLLNLMVMDLLLIEHQLPRDGQQIRFQALPEGPLFSCFRIFKQRGPSWEAFLCYLCFGMKWLDEQTEIYPVFPVRLINR